jgi:hypothetical protein
MPRKQRFRPAHQQIAAGTFTDLDLTDRAGPDEPVMSSAIEPGVPQERPRERSQRYVEPGRRNTNLFAAMYDLGGESG